MASLETINKRLRQHTAVLVPFNQIPRSSVRFCSIEELRQLVPLRVLEGEPDGAIHAGD
jgi:hypothetical protein